MEMPKPTAAHKKLEQLAGSWRGEERMHPSPWDPKGGSAIGWVRNRVALDGFIVVQDYEQERGGQVTFRGHGIFSWDAAEKCYLLHWFDSMGLPPNCFRGQFEGQQLTATDETPQGHTRVVFEFHQEGRYRFRMEHSPDGSQWQCLMDGEYRREG